MDEKPASKSPLSVSPTKEKSPFSVNSAKEKSPLSVNPVKEIIPLSVDPAKERSPLSVNPVSERSPLSVNPASARSPLSADPVSERSPLSVFSSIQSDESRHSSKTGSIASTGLSTAVDSLETIRHTIFSKKSLQSGSKRESGLFSSVGSESSTIDGEHTKKHSSKKVHISPSPAVFISPTKQPLVSFEKRPCSPAGTESDSISLKDFLSRFSIKDEVSKRPMLRGVDAVHVGTVLQDCADQLAVLGSIMPNSFENRPDAAAIVSDDIAQLVEGQLNMEKKYEQLMSKKLTEGRGLAGNKSLAGDLKNSTYMFSRSLKQSPLTPDNLTKVQEDRAFLERIIVNCMGEMKDSGGYQSLVDAVKSEKEKKAKLQQTILKEEEGRKRVKSLQNQLKDVKKDKEIEIQQRNEMIAHLKDQLQEVKAKTNMEGKYVKKVSEVGVAMTQKKCFQSEKEMRENIDLMRYYIRFMNALEQDPFKSLRQQIDEETRVNAEIESYLRTHQSELETKVEYWMEKYDKDVESKQHELDVLKASKAKDLERLQELTKLYAEYEQIVVEDRIDKEKTRRREEQEAIELNSCITVQAWWRGVMVRKGLGPYSKKKKKKGKKGKKSGKKKKK